MADLISLLIPFLFMLAIVFGALEVAGVFRNKRINALIALVFALFTLTYQPAIDFIMQIMPFAIVFFVVFFFVGFAIKMAKKGVEKDFTLLMIVLGLLLLLFATQGPGFIENFLPGFEQQSNTIMMVAAVVFIVMVFWAVYKNREPAPAA